MPADPAPGCGTHAASLAAAQVWRLASNLIYFGTIAQPINYLFHSYFMYTYLRDLEENIFERKSDLVYLFIFAAAVMEVRPTLRSPKLDFQGWVSLTGPLAPGRNRAPVMLLQVLTALLLLLCSAQTYALLVDPTIHFLSPAMMFLVVTVWSRKTTLDTMVWFGVLNFSPKNLPVPTPAPPTAT